MDRWTATAVLLCIAAVGSACGVTNSREDTDPPPVPRMGAITFNAQGVHPKDTVLPAGARLTYVNTDSSPHQLVSDPEPLQTDCPELNGPTLAPGERFTLTIVDRSTPCGFHDHLAPTNSAFFGTVTVGSGTAAGTSSP